MLRELQKTVFGFGTAAVDFRIVTADMGEEYRDKLLAQETHALGGGSMANCLVQIVRLGGSACWLGKIGYDWLADRILDQLEHEGVDSSKVIQDPTVCSPFNLTVYTGTKRQRVGGFLLPHSLETFTKAEIHRLASHVNEDDWVVVEIGGIPLEITLDFCRAVKLRHARLVVDVDLEPLTQCRGARETVHQIFHYANLLVPNRSAIESLYPDLSLETVTRQMAQEFDVSVVVTAGADGIYYCQSGNTVTYQKAVETEVFDSVGAGDAFRGGLLFSLSQGWSLEESIRLGAWCGALNCQSFGARTGMPTLAELGFN